MTDSTLPARGVLEPSKALHSYVLDYPSAPQEVEVRIPADLTAHATQYQQHYVSNAAEKSIIRGEPKRLSYQAVPSHTRDRLLFMVQRYPLLELTGQMAGNAIRKRRSSCIPNFTSDVRVSFTIPHEDDGKKKHYRTQSLPESVLRMRFSFAREVRRYVKHLSLSSSETEAAVKKVHDKGYRQMAPKSLDIKSLTPKPVLRIIKAEPEVVTIGTSMTRLEIQRVDTPPTLKVVEAIAIADEGLDDFAYSDYSEDTDNEPAEAARHTALDDIPAISLDPHDWPLPKADASSKALLEVAKTEHPHPLRANPTSPGSTSHNKHSTSSSARSARSNRRAVVVQRNDSNLSLHSQGTVTDVDMTRDAWLTSSSSSTPSSQRRLSKMFSLERANAVRHRSSCSNSTESDADSSQPRRSGPRHRHFRSTSLAVLTPVSETFEKLSETRDSAGTHSTVQPSRQSTLTLATGHQGSEHRATRFRFHGAMVGHSRKGWSMAS